MIFRALDTPRADPERVAVWLLGFGPATYLALSGGGYDVVVRSEVGIAVCWLVLLGMLAGLLPRARMPLAGWTAALLLGAFLAWTWIAVNWSGSREQTLDEAGRVAGYVGVLLLGLSVVTRETVRSLLSGLACAITLVSALAVLSRLQPAWFPADSAANFYATSRLSYPFDYSDGVGEFAALGLPLLLFLASDARTIAGRALAAAGIPAVGLCLALTVSRGGMLAAAAGLIVFFALAPDRLPRLATALAAAGGVTVAMVALLHRAGVRNAFLLPAPAGQRHSMLLVLVLVCVGVGLVQTGISLAVLRGRRPRRLVVSPRQARAFAAVLGLGVVAAVIVAVASGADHRLWEQFKQPNPPSGDKYLRLLSVAGSHRYQYWQAAIAAFHTSPWKGIGPGTFQFYWAQHNSLSEYVLNAHSLYIETLAELGIIGVALIGGLFAFVLADGVVRVRRSTPALALPIATAVASFAGFCAAAAFDWVWQIGVMPLIAMLLVAAALCGVRSPEPIGPGRGRPRTRAALALGCVISLWAIAVPLAMTDAVRSSQAAVRRGDYRAALSDASTAQRLEPSAASPRLQQALILERLGDIGGASRAIGQAQSREKSNWRLWLVGSQIATESDRPRLALAEYRRARALDPTSPIFAK
jgi:hypothetical protein